MPYILAFFTSKKSKLWGFPNKIFSWTGNSVKTVHLFFLACAHFSCPGPSSQMSNDIFCVKFRRKIDTSKMKEHISCAIMRILFLKEDPFGRSTDNLPFIWRYIFLSPTKKYLPRISWKKAVPKCDTVRYLFMKIISRKIYDGCRSSQPKGIAFFWAFLK